MQEFIFMILTGASGAGKTTITQEFRRSHPEIACFFFDLIGVPSPERMISEYGSGEEWQRQMTVGWLTKLKREGLPKHPVLFEGQIRIAFIKEALQNGVSILDTTGRSPIRSCRELESLLL